MLDLVTGWEDWLGGQVGRSHGGGRAGHRRGVAGYFCALEEEQGVVRDIDIILLAIVPTYSLTLESST